MFSFGGQQQQQQQTSGLFGQPATSSQFGVAPPVPGQLQTGGLFGSSSTPASSSLFGAPAATASGGLFGQAASAAPSPFGQPSTPGVGGGMFGQQQVGGGGLFGSQQSVVPSPTPSNAFGASPFGGVSSASPSSSGTAGQKYQLTRDQELNMRLVSITAMDYYKNKSLEELRWEDYQANRASSSQPASGQAWGGGMFGGSSTSTTASPAASTSTGLFGGGPTSTFGSSSTGAGLFGASGTASGSSGLFGSSTATTSGGLFGGSSTASPAATSTGLFGGGQASSTGGGLFGTSAQPSTGGASGGLFGTTTQPSTGLFGSSTPAGSAGGLFGSTAQPSTGGSGLFGSTAQPSTGGGLFGTTAQPSTAGVGGLFGSTAQPSTGGSGLFGTTPQPSTGGGLFGTTAQPSTAGVEGLFGSTAQPSTGGSGLFGSTAQPSTGGGLFGTTTQPSTGGGLFGTAAQPSSTGVGGLFGTTTTQPSSTGVGGLFGTTVQPSTTTGGLFGGTGTGGGLFGTTPSGGGVGVSSSSASGGLFGSSANTTSSGLGFAQGSLFGSPVVPSVVGSSANLVAPPPVPRPTGLVIPKAMDKDSLAAFLWRGDGGTKPSRASLITTPVIKMKETSCAVSIVPPPAALPGYEEIVNREDKPMIASAPPLRLNEEEVVFVRPEIVYTRTGEQKPASPTSVKKKKKNLPIISNHNLWTKPSIEAMEGMTEHELSRIEHFQIGHYGIGSVTWPGLTDVRYLNIDDIIVFKKGAVTLFPNEDLKPPEGTGLNKTAIIELLVRPRNIEVARKYESRYVEEMRKLTVGNGAEFLSYDLDTWRFRVEHFSTWGIDEVQWLRIDHHDAAGRFEDHHNNNDLSLFNRIEREISVNTPSERGQEFEEDENKNDQDEIDMEEREFIGALSVAPPTREELKAMGWDLKVFDLFLNQSFRACISLEGKCWFPEHPVVCNTFNVDGTLAQDHDDVDESDFESIKAIIFKLLENKDKGSSFDDTVTALLSKDTTKSDVSLFSLIQALGSCSNIVGGINTKAFNEWLSRANADSIKKDNPAKAFSAASAMCSRHYAPSASEILVKAGYPRLALAAAAGVDDASRAIMKDQMSRIVEDDSERQAVADILGGRCDRLKTILDWKAELALRYWFSEGDLSGFEPPSNSIEWRLIRAVVLHETKELVRLIDEKIGRGEDLFYIFAAVWLLKLRNAAFVSDKDLHRVVIACSDFVLANSHKIDWQLSPVMLSFLPNADDLRNRLIYEIVARKTQNEHNGCPLLIKLGIVNEQLINCYQTGQSAS